MTPNLEPVSDAPPSPLRSLVVYCRICLGEHDPEIHEATVNVRRWFRDEVTKSFQPPPQIIVA